MISCTSQKYLVMLSGHALIAYTINAIMQNMTASQCYAAQNTCNISMAESVSHSNGTELN